MAGRLAGQGAACGDPAFGSDFRRKSWHCGTWRFGISRQRHPADGGAAINQLCTVNNLGLKVFDLALDLPTPDITLKDAFDEKTCAATMAFGMEAIAGGTDLLCIGEMGIANTTVAAAIFHALYGGRPEDWVGAGTGVDAAGLKRKADVVRRAVGRAGVSKTNGLEALRRLGGREIAAMCGAMLAARVERIPVIVDGFVATASAAILHSVVELGARAMGIGGNAAPPCVR